MLHGTLTTPQAFHVAPKTHQGRHSDGMAWSGCHELRTILDHSRPACIVVQGSYLYCPVLRPFLHLGLKHVSDKEEETIQNRSPATHQCISTRWWIRMLRNDLFPNSSHIRQKPLHIILHLKILRVTFWWCDVKLLKGDSFNGKSRWIILSNVHQLFHDTECPRPPTNIL